MPALRNVALAAGSLLAVALPAGVACADSTSDLVELDRQWGLAATRGDTAAVAKLLGDGLVSVDDTAVRDKKGELELVKPEPAGTQYEPTDYKVTFLGEDVAIMTHATAGKDAHHSMHVWARKNGQWQVVATSSTPAKK